MKASRFSEAQIAFVLKQAEDGTPIGEVCRKAGISDATFYYLWTVLPLQEDFGSGLIAIDCKHLYGVFVSERPNGASARMRLNKW